MRTALRIVALFGLVAPVGCGSGAAPAAEVQSALGVSYAVHLKTIVVGDYVTAENGGGGDVNANRAAASSWETFTLFDLDGGALQDGDQVQLAALDGDFVAAED